MVTQPHGAEPNGKQPSRTQNARLLEQLIASHGALLHRQAAKHSQRPVDAEDALHDAYALFLQRFHGRLPALPYLMTTIKHSAWAISRRPDRSREYSAYDAVGSDSEFDPWELIPDPSNEPQTQAERHEELERRRAAILALKPDERRALLLLGAGLSYREIAELNDWTLTKVNRCLAEGRAALRRAGVPSEAGASYRPSGAAAWRGFDWLPPPNKGAPG
jgi:RNA polymerase sigma factor (sigma-70 family)